MDFKNIANVMFKRLPNVVLHGFFCSSLTMTMARTAISSTPTIVQIHIPLIIPCIPGMAHLSIVTIAARSLERFLRLVRDPEQQDEASGVLDPPDMQEAIEKHAGHDDRCHIAAGNRLGDVGAQRPALQLAIDATLPRGEKGHEHHGCGGDR